MFAGQAGLLSGQQQIGRNITGELGGLGSDLASFRTAAEAYQRQAETARGDIQGTQRAGQSELERQIGGVGLASNRAAEMLTQQRQAEALAARQARSADLAAQQGLGTYQTQLGGAERQLTQADLAAQQESAREAAFADYTRLGLIGPQLASVIGGFPAATQVQSTPPPSTTQQLLGLGIGAAGLGGAIKGLF